MNQTSGADSDRFRSTFRLLVLPLSIGIHGVISLTAKAEESPAPPEKPAIHLERAEIDLRDRVLADRYLELILDQIFKYYRKEYTKEELTTNLRPMVFHFWLLYSSDFKFSGVNDKTAHTGLDVIRKNIIKIYGGDFANDDPLAILSGMKPASTINEAVKWAHLYPESFLKSDLAAYKKCVTHFKKWISPE